MLVRELEAVEWNLVDWRLLIVFLKVELDLIVVLTRLGSCCSQDGGSIEF